MSNPKENTVKSNLKTSKDVKLGHNVCMCQDTDLGKGVIVGNNVTFYGKVKVGNGTRILDGAVLGRPPISNGNITRKISKTQQPLIIGKDCIIGANAVLYMGSTIGNRVLIGDLASIREGCILDDDVVAGRGVMIMYDTKIGKRTRIIDDAILTGNMTVEEDVFFGPDVNTINNNVLYLSRYGLETPNHLGPTIRRFALIGAGSNLSAGVEIGRGAIVAPNAMVTHDVEPWTVVAGIPAQSKRDIDPQEKNRLLKHFGLNK